MPHALGLRMSGILLLGGCFFHPPVGAQSIFTVAGGGTDDGRPATVASLRNPLGVAIDGSGNLFVADESDAVVRRVSADTGIIDRYAGTHSPGFSGDGGPATLALLLAPAAIALDRRGNLFIADASGCRIRKVDAASGAITTVAGNGAAGFSGDGGPATAASVNHPLGIAIDTSENIYLCDSRNDRIRRIDGSTGLISTLAGNGSAGFSGDGGPATLASFRFSDPAPAEPPGVAVDAAGNVFVADRDNHRIRRIDAGSGIVTTVAGNGATGYSGEGDAATRASIGRPSGITVNGDGDLFISTTEAVGGGRVLRVSASTGTLRTIAGGGALPATGTSAPATSVRLGYLAGIALASNGTLFVADPGYLRVGRLDLAIATFSYVVGNGLYFLSDEGGPATSAGLEAPAGLKVDERGDIYIAEAGRIRRVDSLERRIETFKSGFGKLAGMVGDLGGDIYVADRWLNKILRVSISTGAVTAVAGTGARGFSGDAGPATAASIDLLNVDGVPVGLALDKEGNLAFADAGNYRIRRINVSDGKIVTLAGDGNASTLDWCFGLAYDVNDDLIVTSIGKVIRITPSGTMTTIAGIGVTGELGWDSIRSPLSVAIDRDGSLLVTDAYYFSVRRIDLQRQTARTVVGTASRGSTGDSGPATAASLSWPHSIVVSPDGGQYIVDGAVIRTIPPCGPVSVPTLLSPSDRSSGVATPPRLEWQGAGGGFRYDVYLDTVNPPTKLAEANIVATSCGPTNLEPLTTYYWSVIARGDPFCTPLKTSTSEARSFTTTGVCSPPGAFGENGRQ